MRSLLIPASLLLFGASGCIVHDRPYRTVEYREQGYYYSGAHPYPGDGGWCLDESQHLHEYAPDYAYYTRQDNYYVYSGPTTVWYYGYHPVPEGGHCGLHGRHSHHYHPGHHYSNAYTYDRGQQVYVYDAHKATAVTPPPGRGTGYSPPGHGSGHPGYNRPPPPGHANSPPSHVNRPPPGQGSGHPNQNQPGPGYNRPPGHATVPATHINDNVANPPPGHGGVPPGHGGRPPGRGAGTPGHITPGNGNGRPSGGYTSPGHAYGRPNGNGSGHGNGQPGHRPVGTAVPGGHSGTLQRPPSGSPPAQHQGNPNVGRPGHAVGQQPELNTQRPPQQHGNRNPGHGGTRPSFDRPNELPHKVEIRKPPERVNNPKGPHLPSSGPVEKKRQEDRFNTAPAPSNGPSRPASIGRGGPGMPPAGGRR